MKYSFPVIRHIDDVEQHRAAGLIHDAFKRGERHSGTIVYDCAFMEDAMEAVKGVVHKAVGASARFDALASALELPKLTFGFEGDQ